MSLVTNRGEMRGTKKIRSKKLQTDDFLLQFGYSLSRSQALEDIYTTLSQDSISPSVLRLIEIFHFSPEELSETGLSYEMIKTIEQLTVLNCMN
ncbi:MAG: hypothetical protein AAGI66_08745 [Cyanobacteria bacterium P01_H01_bin.74]